LPQLGKCTQPLPPASKQPVSRHSKPRPSLGEWLPSSDTPWSMFLKWRHSPRRRSKGTPTRPRHREN
jgi:hypothetical protein